MIGAEMAMNVADRPVVPREDATGSDTLAAARSIPGTRLRRKSAGRRRIVLIGNCQLGVMAALYDRYVAGGTGDVLKVIASYEDLTPEAAAAIEQADLVVEQVLDLGPQADTAGLAAAAPRIFVPVVTAAFLWPFSGQAHPNNTPYPFMPIGPYPGEAGDSYLNRMILANADPEEAVAAYEALDVTSRVNLGRLHELVMDRQRSRDEATGYQIADAIEAHFRTEQVFLTPYHPNTRIAMLLATQLFRQLGASEDDIDRMRAGTRVTPFPKDETPLHPSVCRHWGLDFVTPDRRYRFLREGSFTFRESALRYMRYEWNDALEKGLFYNHSGNLDAALALLKMGVTRSPDSAEGHSALARALFHAGDNEQGLAALRRCIGIDPETGSYRASLGERLRLLGRLEEAEEILRSAVACEPAEPHNHRLLANLLKQRGDAEGSIRCLQQASLLDPYAVGPRMELASQRAAAGDIEGGIRELQDVLTFQPDNAAVHARLAQILAGGNRIQDAIAPLRKAVELAPDASQYRVLLSDFLLRLQQPEEALTDAYTAAICDPSSPRAYAHLAHVLRLTGDAVAAEAALRQAARLAPGDVQLRRELSAMLLQAKRFEEAVAVAREAAEIGGGNAEAYAHLAHVLARMDDLDGAEAALRTAIGLAPAKADFRVVLSDVLARQRRLDEALAEVRLAVQQNPNDAQAQGHLAHILQMTGSVAEADSVFRRAIELAPGNAHLRNQWAALQARRAQAAAG
jgi:Flp pilus assembly protein TadD